jgi:DNA-binding PadR family transcriptional regulator
VDTDRALGRFSKPALLILTTLAEGFPKHGYVIMTDIKHNFDVQLGPGTLYGALARLHKLHLIEPVDSEDRRQPYRITRRGAMWLSSELTGLGKVTSQGLSRLRVLEGTAADSTSLPAKTGPTGSVKAV